MIDEFKESIPNGSWMQHGRGLKKIEHPKRLRLRTSKGNPLLDLARLYQMDPLFRAAWARI